MRELIERLELIEATDLVAIPKHDPDYTSRDKKRRYWRVSDTEWLGHDSTPKIGRYTKKATVRKKAYQITKRDDVENFMSLEKPWQDKMGKAKKELHKKSKSAAEKLMAKISAEAERLHPDDFLAQLAYVDAYDETHG